MGNQLNEIRNAEKQMKTTAKELQSLQKKYDRVKDWKHLSNLYKQTDEDQRKIQRLEKDNKKLRADQKKAEFKIAKHMKNVPDNLFQEDLNYSELIELPSGGDLGHWYWAARKMGTDSTMICPARRSVQWISAAHSGRAPAYLYVFQHRPDGPSGSYPLAAHHSSELPFVFRVENADDDGMLAEAFRFNTSRERPLADEMADALITFAATGMPPIGWPAYDDVNQSMMLFGTPSGQLLTGTVAHGLKRAHCSLWDKTADRLESTVDASQLVHTAQTLHYSVEQQLLFTADPEDEDLKPLPNEPPVVDGPTARLRAKAISGDSSRALQP